MAHISVPDRGILADRKLAKLQQDILDMEKQMKEQADMRRRVEQMQTMETSRTDHVMVGSWM